MIDVHGCAWQEQPSHQGALRREHRLFADRLPRVSELPLLAGIPPKPNVSAAPAVPKGGGQQGAMGGVFNHFGAPARVPGLRRLNRGGGN